MPKLNATLVDRLFAYCSFRQTEDTDGAIVVEGVRRAWWGFHPDRLKEASELLRWLVSELPVQFREENAGGGGGWSFLNACEDKDGNPWGEHAHMEELIMMAVAAKLMRPFAGRSRDADMPGGMPFYTIITQPGREMTEEGHKNWQMANAKFFFKLTTGFNPSTADQQFFHWLEARRPSEEEVKEVTKIDHFTGLLAESPEESPLMETPKEPEQVPGIKGEAVIAQCSCGARLGMEQAIAIEIAAGRSRIKEGIGCPKCHEPMEHHIAAAVLQKVCAAAIPNMDAHIKKPQKAEDFTNMWRARSSRFAVVTGLAVAEHHDAFVAWVKDHMPDPDHVAVNEAYRAHLDMELLLMRMPASQVGIPVIDKEDVGYTMLHDDAVLMQGDESAAYGGGWEVIDDKFIGLTVEVARGGEDLKARGFRRKLPEQVA